MLKALHILIGPCSLLSNFFHLTYHKPLSMPINNVFIINLITVYHDESQFNQCPVVKP